MPFEALIYNLTQLFHCTPSQLLEEDNELLMNMLTVHNTYSTIDEKHREMEERNKKSKINMKVSKHITIGLELEKLKGS